MNKKDMQEMVGDKYTLEEIIGQGGAGEVWKAYLNNDISSKVAIKFLTKNGDSKIRFNQEIDIIIKLNGNGAIKIHNFLYDKWYSMDLHEKTLDKYMDKEFKKIDIKINTFLKICNSLEKIHKEKIFHRDIKPKNIIISKEGEIIFLDFGIAKIQDNNITKSNSRLANFDYHAPEQRMKKEKEITAQTDIYSMGLLLNQFFTNRIPKGNNYTKIIDIPEYMHYYELDNLIQKMINYDPTKRPNSIIEVINEITHISKKQNKEIESLNTEVWNNPEGIIQLTQQANSIYKQLKNKKINFEYFLNKYEANYNNNLENISFKVKEYFLNSLYIKSIYNEVKSKFEYEGTNEYREGILYETKDLDISYYENLKKILDNIDAYDKEDQKGIILLYFRKLVNYHGEEILRKIKRIKEMIYKNFTQQTILGIIHYVFIDIQKEEYNILPENLFELIEPDYSELPCYYPPFKEILRIKDHIKDFNKILILYYPCITISQEGIMLFKIKQEQYILINKIVKYYSKDEFKKTLHLIDAHDIVKKITFNQPLDSFDLNRIEKVF